MHKMSTGMVLAATTLAAFMFAAPARAGDEVKPRIIVSGEGEATAVPDMALVSLTVLRDGVTAREALDANSKAMADVLGSMKKFGIADRDLQTSGFSIQPRYQYPDPNKNETFAPKIVGYTVVNTLGVRIRDLAKVGEVLDQSVTLGVNEGGNVIFSKDDPSADIEEARKKAVVHAVAKAKTLTLSAGVTMGRILEISEQSYQPAPLNMMQADMKSENSARVPMAAGESSYRVSVNVTFEIVQ